MDFFRRQDWDIVKYSWLWFTISAILIAIGMSFCVGRRLNWGIDFTGGSLLRYEFEQPLITEPGQGREVTQQTRRMLAEMGLGKSQILVAGDNRIYIRTPEIENDKEARERDTAVEAGLTKLFGDQAGGIQSLGRETVGPVIGEMLTRSAIQALALGIAFILIYITVRYEFRFAVAAVIALIHDTAILVGALAILQTELNTWFVAALLTVLGYSMNDTVIIFDRIRENRGLHRRAPLDSVVNASLLQTMARSLNTVITTLFTLIALYLLGGATIEGFALALIIGITTGCYSSIFTASPIVVAWYHIADRRAGRAPSPARAASATSAAEGAAGSVELDEQQEEEEEEAAKPSARQTMREAERAAQEEKRRKRRERRKEKKDSSRGRERKKRF
ncbi:MAG: protein translocase subunit SecF [Armatimonadota bacterium]|nr:protein translocase subunit SecF [Armatimonadota bacterium]